MGTCTGGCLLLRCPELLIAFHGAFITGYGLQGGRNTAPKTRAAALCGGGPAPPPPHQPLPANRPSGHAHRRIVLITDFKLFWGLPAAPARARPAQFHTRLLVAFVRLDAPCNLSPDSSGPARPRAAAPRPPARHPTAAAASAAAAPGSWATAAPAPSLRSPALLPAAISPLQTAL